ncbi:CRISPR-associated endonuclease Cas1 [candidate division KSB1 bacterium]|nr:CRISPR-associated endonuclease Cas1 [bacterium]NUM68402.1 CRISPR-associated endonuclease Cas1 [candidate division KSB1 bacterium]
MSALYISEYGTSIGVVNDRVQIRRKGKVVQEVPALHLERVVLLTPANITLPAVRFLMERGIDIAYLSPNGTFHGQFTRGDGKFVEQRLAQFRRFHEAEFRLALAKQFVTGKVSNMLALWKRQRRNSEWNKELTALDKIARTIAAAPNLESLLGTEGSASAAHFRIFRQALQGEWRFERRLAHPSPDPINAMLSLGYTLLYSRMSGLLQMHGLDPYLGFFHEPKRGHAALASDLIEEWRSPVVDALVLKLVNGKQMVPADFHAARGECRMERPALQKFIAAFEQRLKECERMNAPHDSDDLVGGLEGQIRQLIRVLLGKQKEYAAVKI